MVDLAGKRIHVVSQAMRRRADDATKTPHSIRTVPIPDYLIPDLHYWKTVCPVSSGGLVFPGPPNELGKRGPIDADKLLRNILRRALRKAGLPPIRFHDLRHLAGTLMSEAGVPPKRAQEILGHADVRTTLAIYTHTLKRKHDDSANRMANIAGLSSLTRVWPDGRSNSEKLGLPQTRYVSRVVNMQMRSELSDRPKGLHSRRHFRAYS
jgi:integrase